MSKLDHSSEEISPAALRDENMTEQGRGPRDGSRRGPACAEWEPGKEDTTREPKMGSVGRAAGRHRFPKHQWFHIHSWI